jgi:hypothetical protein
LGRSLAIALALLAIVAGIPGLSRAMLSPLLTTVEGNETEAESPTEESANESISIGLVASRVRELRVALSNDRSLPLASAFRRPGRHDSARCRGAAALLSLRC